VRKTLGMLEVTCLKGAYNSAW